MYISAACAYSLLSTQLSKTAVSSDQIALTDSDHPGYLFQRKQLIKVFFVHSCSSTDVGPTRLELFGVVVTLFNMAFTDSLRLN